MHISRFAFSASNKEQPRAETDSKTNTRLRFQFKQTHFLQPKASPPYLEFLADSFSQMAFWYFLHSRLRNRATAKQRVFYAGRPEYAAPAEGLLYAHKAAQAELVDTALRGVEVTKGRATLRPAS